MRGWSFACLALVMAGAAHAEEHVYVRDASGAEWAATTGPLPEVELGAWAARLFNPARAPSVEPELVWRPAPVVLETGHARVAALHLRIPFEVGPELAEVRLLTLRVRYQDGLVASVNDTEIARRNVATTVRAHGSEQEAIYVAVTPGLLHEGSNVLALEVRAAPSRLAPSIDVALAGSDLGHIVRGPLVQRLGERSATIAFETDLPMVGEVRWGASEKYDHVAAEARATLRHVIALADLPPGGVVHYAVAARMAPEAADDAKIGRASCRERV